MIPVRSIAGRLHGRGAVDAKSPPAAGIRTRQEEPRAKVETAASGMDTLAEVWQVPMAAYGPGDSRLDHADDEHIVLAACLRSIAVLSRALLERNDVRRTVAPNSAPRTGEANYE